MKTAAKTKNPFRTFFEQPGGAISMLASLVMVIAAVPNSATAQFRIAFVNRPYRMVTNLGLGHYVNPYAGIPYSFSDYGYVNHRYNYYYDPAMRLKQDWWARENSAFKKLEFERSTDERVARAHLERLIEIKRGLTRFVNGGTRPMDGAGFRAALAEIEASHSQTRFMQQVIQPIAPEMMGEFQARGIVTGSGELRQPPQVLYSRTASDVTHPAWIELNAAWRDARWNLIQGNMAPTADVERLSSSLREMQTAAQPRLVAANRSQRKLASRYLRAADRLVRDLQDQVASLELTKHLNAGRRGFQGGTVGDYVRFVAENKVQIAYGTPAHQVLTDFTIDLQRDLDEQIAVTNANIERLKAQNPAHNAALKEQAIAANQTRQGYGFYQDGLRPSLFNHAPQSQTSGLQSQAYGVTPQPSAVSSGTPYTLPASLRVPSEGSLHVGEDRFAAR